MRNIFLFVFILAFNYHCRSQQSAQPQNDTPKELVADNGILTLKLDLTRGGAISYLSLTGSDRSVVNIADEGRYIQQSYYAGKSLDRKAEGQAPRWSPWPWNPIQVGDAFRNRAKILEYKQDKASLYVRCIPMQWDMNNKPAEAEMEQWTTLNGNVLEVRNRLTCRRTDNVYGDSLLCSQELPAVYPISALKNLFTYQGTAPFSKATVQQLEVKNLSSGFWGVYKDVTENWMAFTDENKWGMAVYNPMCTDFLAGLSGVVGKEASDGSTSYIAPVKKAVLYKTSVYEYSYYILIGTLDEMRNKIYSLRTAKDSLNADIVIQSKELDRLNLALPDGGIMPVPGVLNIQLFRSSKDVPEMTDGDGWTYAHHMDLAVWKGRMYAAWNMTLKDEDRPPSKVVFSTSADGLTWTRPDDLFPREWAWACRFYFFLSGNNRMLAFCAAKSNNDGKISEDKKSILLVREIKPDHRLGDVFTLINPQPGLPASFEDSADKDFVAACREAVANNVLLEQQDYGVFLGSRKMEWHDKTPPYKGFYKFGKAFCFYHRADGKLVGMSKMGFVTLSEDEGKTWSEPTQPKSLTAGAAKVWGQKTYDNRYILAYNPDPKRGKRFPLVMVQGEDGIHFHSMQVIHGEFSPLRYPGLYKDFGYQYVRGVPEWSDDHSFNDKHAIWLIYSVNKEDVWISRIPLPAVPVPTALHNEDFNKMPLGPVVRDWNLYCPKWAPVSVTTEPGKPGNRCLELRDSDPVDHAQAQRVFPPSQSININFRVKPMQTNGYFEAALENDAGTCALLVILSPDGSVSISSSEGIAQIGTYAAGKWLSVNLNTDPDNKTLKVRLEGNPAKPVELKWENPDNLQRLVFRTGKRYELLAPSALAEGTDRPAAEATIFLVDDVTLKSK